MNSLISAQNFSNDNITSEAWRKLGSARLFFGHQSVGANLVNGLEAMVPEEMVISELTEQSISADDIFLLHSHIGRNGEPLTKTAGFADFLDSGLGQELDFAFMKFCFVDVTAQTDIDELFNDYVSTIDSLKIKYPHITFIHFTVPLTTQDGKVRAFVKRLVGKDSWGIDANQKRQKYNELLRERYFGKEPLFDIARFESTASNGNRIEHQEDGFTYFSLDEEYTQDGGHLNREAELYMAERFLIFLSNLS